MTFRSASLLAAVALAGLAVAALAQGGGFDPGPPPPLPEAIEAEGDPDEVVEEQQGEDNEIVYESYEVVQPIDETPGPAARTIEPPTDEWVEAEPAPAPARSAKLIKLERVAQAPTPDKRVRIR